MWRPETEPAEIDPRQKPPHRGRSKWEKTKARIRHPSGIAALLAFAGLLYIESTGADESGVLRVLLALANLVLVFWSWAAEKEREAEERRGSDGVDFS